MRYSLRQLEVFLEVARHESVSRAAAALHLSQSAVSGALAEFERQFDVLLFDRVGKRVQLSDRGQLLRHQAQRVLDEARDLERELSEPSALGPLSIGATMTIGDHLAVPLLARFKRAHPRVQLSLVVANTEEIARRVANLELDVGLVEGELSHAELEITPWRDDELVVFCAPEHPWARRRALGDAELRQGEWIVREAGSGTRQAFDRAMHGILSELRIALTLQHTQALKTAVAEGMGVGCVSRLALEVELRQRSLVACRVPGRDFSRRFFFVKHRLKATSPSLAAWLAICRGRSRGP